MTSRRPAPGNDRRVDADADDRWYAVYLRGRFGGAEGLWFGGYGPGTVAYLPSDELLPPLRSGGSYAGGWNPDFPGLAGGSMCAYGWPGHFLAGGVQTPIVDAVTGVVV